MTIMIVDDNAKMRKFIRSYFLDVKTRIVEFCNGQEAVEKFGLFCPDYVFMDIKMPVMDGIEATGIITRSYPSAKVIIVTEYNDEHLREVAEKAGACEYILKDNLSVLKTYCNELT